MRVGFDPAARSEFKSAAVFYNKQVPGLGDQFIASIQDAIDKISKSPDIWPIVYDDVRRYVMHGFPYCLFYRKTGPGRLRFLAIAHHSRAPDYWHARIAH